MKFGERFFFKSFNRRILLLSSIKTVLFSVLGVRLWWLQIRKNDKYYSLAEGNRIDLRFILPGRGRIITSDHVSIADIKPRFNLIIIPYHIKNIDETFNQLNNLIEIPDDKLTEIRKNFSRLNKYASYVIKTFDNWQQASRITDHLYHLPGVDISVNLMRFYPGAKAFSHLTGYIGAVNKSEQADDTDPVLRIPDMKIGKHGVEKIADKTLRGQAGTLKVEVNNIGLVRQELSRTNAISGNDVHLTLNHALHEHATQDLQDESGATCVINVRNGAVLAMASTPGYDPNLFIDGISHQNWNALRLDEKAPMNNKAIMGLYPPGSTFKMITLIAALEAGTITPEDSFFCPGHLNVGNSRIYCWKRNGHGHVNGIQALEGSCDVYFYEIALRTGIKKISQVAQRYGLGALTGITLPYEKSGLVPDRDWKLKRYGKKWTIGDTVNVSIGQGSLLVTPLQLAVMTARLATNRKIEPILFAKDLDKQEFPIMETENTEFIDIARQGMFQVVNGAKGTARASAIDNLHGFSAGKTGTAQVRRISKAERKRGVIKNEKLPWKYRDHALYVGFAPYENPLFAVATVVAHGGSGSRAAAPRAKNILDHALEIHKSENNQIISDI